MKGLNLVLSNIRELHILVVDDANGDPVDAKIKTLVEIFDDAGNYVKSENIDEDFSTMSAQRRMALNNYLRLSSKEYMNTTVNENKESWVDL